MVGTSIETAVTLPEDVTSATEVAPVTFKLVIFAVVEPRVAIVASVLCSLGRTLLIVDSLLMIAPVLVRDLTVTSAAVRSTVPLTVKFPPIVAPAVVVIDLALTSVDARSIDPGITAPLTVKSPVIEVLLPIVTPVALEIDGVTRDAVVVSPLTFKVVPTTTSALVRTDARLDGPVTASSVALTVLIVAVVLLSTGSTLALTRSLLLTIPEAVSDLTLMSADDKSKEP
ncbi:Uncharacterised protein [Escherichia coli]|nr:Uncharacterised protein [Escherichia coli]